MKRQTSVESTQQQAWRVCVSTKSCEIAAMSGLSLETLQASLTSHITRAGMDNFEEWRAEVEEERARFEAKQKKHHLSGPRLAKAQAVFKEATAGFAEAQQLAIQVQICVLESSVLDKLAAAGMQSFEEWRSKFEEERARLEKARAVFEEATAGFAAAQSQCDKVEELRRNLLRPGRQVGVVSSITRIQVTALC